MSVYFERYSGYERWVNIVEVTGWSEDRTAVISLAHTCCNERLLTRKRLERRFKT